MSRRHLVAGGVMALLLVAVVLVARAITDDGGDGGSAAEAGAEGVAVEVTTDGETTEGCLLLADSDEERQQGLMGVTDLGGFDGMLFEFPDQQPRSFWMRNTPMPLSIAFYDGAGGFISSADMSPCGDREDCPLTSSAAPAMYAVEVPQGKLPALGMVQGSRLALDGTCRR